MTVKDILKPTKWKLLVFSILVLIGGYYAFFFSFMIGGSLLNTLFGGGGGCYPDGHPTFPVLCYLGIILFYLILYCVSALLVYGKPAAVGKRLNERKRQVYIILVSTLFLLLVWYLWSIYVVSRSNSDSLCITGIAGARDDCFSNVAFNQQNGDLCVKVSEPVKKNRCIMEVAKIKLDRALCTRIDNEEPKNDCLFYIAIKTQDTSVCKAMFDTLRGNECIIEIASYKQNKTLCEEIEAPPYSYKRDECLSMVGDT